eukprot:scaffold2775_cov171-Ochromonas_danica.AAC.2
MRYTGRGNVQQIEEHGSTGGWRFREITQPAQSPDLILLDLSFFQSLKSGVEALKVSAKTIDQLSEKVQQAYDQYDRKTLDYIWAHLFACYNAILKDNGGNQYPKPHIGARNQHKVQDTSVDLTIDIDEYNRVYDDLRN